MSEKAVKPQSKESLKALFLLEALLKQVEHTECVCSYHENSASHIMHCIEKMANILGNPPTDSTNISQIQTLVLSMVSDSRQVVEAFKECRHDLRLYREKYEKSLEKKEKS